MKKGLDDKRDLGRLQRMTYGLSGLNPLLGAEIADSLNCGVPIACLPQSLAARTNMDVKIGGAKDVSAEEQRQFGLLAQPRSTGMEPFWDRPGVTLKFFVMTTLIVPSIGCHLVVAFHGAKSQRDNKNFRIGLTLDVVLIYILA
jgi:hypothetical protein